MTEQKTPSETHTPETESPGSLLGEEKTVEQAEKSDYWNFPAERKLTKRWKIAFMGLSSFVALQLILLIYLMFIA